MGNPLIQPMMYFQLNNMPMFRGIYTIIKVSHKITPHNMTTTFTGNRIRAVKSPLIPNETIYMNLIGSVDATSLSDDGSSDRDGTDVLKDSKINFDSVENSDDLYVQNSNGLVYVYDTSNGLAGKDLRRFMKDLTSYLQQQHPDKNIELASNGITRDLESTVKGGASRSSTSKHGAGLAMDMVFTGIYNGKELGNPYVKSDKRPKYGWPSGNKTVANDTEVMKSIQTFLQTNEKWKDLITWGAYFSGKGKLGRKKIDGFDSTVRLDEIHHFEIKDGKFAKYTKPVENKMNELGIQVPTRQKELASLYSYPFTSNVDNDETINRTVKEDDTSGDSVDRNTNIT
jgi:hypothetical protein